MPYREAGTMDKFIKIQKISGTQDSFGQEVLDWEDFADCYASIEPLTGRERETGAMLAATEDHKITIDYCLGVSPKMRVLYGSRKFNIQSVLLERENPQFAMVLMCLEVV